MTPAFRTCLSSPSNFDRPDLVLIQTPGWGIATPPLALATLGAYIRSKGRKVLCLDLNIEHYSARDDRFKNVWEVDQSQSFWNNHGAVDDYLHANRDVIETHVDAIVRSRTPVVGFSVYNSCLQVSFHYARLIKAADPRIRIVFGGPHASRDMAGRWAAEQEYIDAAVQGEGEELLAELVDRFITDQPIFEVRGLMYRKDGQIVDTGDRPLIHGLDSLPHADFSDFDFSRYRDSTTLPIMGSRGCPNKCIYCSERAYWRTYRGFSPERVVDEIGAQMSKHPFLNRVEFQDSLVNGHIKRLERFAELVIERGLKFDWVGQAVIRKEMTFELFTKLRRSGCSCLAYGLETSTTTLMLKIGKLLSKETDIDRLVEDAHRAGISCAYNFMFGMPGETEEDARASLEFLWKHKDHVGAVNPSASFCGFTRGTPGYEEPEKFGIVPSPTEGQYWETTDGDNDLLVRLGRFEAFCKLANDLKVPTTYPHRQLIDRDRLIGCFYHYKRQYDKAAEHLERWVATSPHDDEARQKLEESLSKLK